MEKPKSISDILDNFHELLDYIEDFITGKNDDDTSNTTPVANTDNVSNSNFNPVIIDVVNTDPVANTDNNSPYYNPNIDINDPTGQSY